MLSYSGYRYYISFIDAFSCFIWIFLLKHKSDALQTFSNFKTQVELQLGYKIKVIQTNWEREYRVFTNLLMSHGIIHRNSYPHTHEQNGVEKRKHRHIVENDLILLAKASMPLKYWDETFRATVFLYNKLPISVFHWKTHLEVLFHSSLSYSMLRVSGCACYPNTRPYNRHKLNFRSTKCTFLGYNLNHKVYKCLDKNDKIFISRDVIFYEHSFSFSSSNSLQTYLPSQASNFSSIYGSSPLPPNFLSFSDGHLLNRSQTHVETHIG